MTVALLDTGVLIVRADAADQHHDAATEIVHGIDHGELPTSRVTNSIVLETLNWIHARKYHRKAVEIYRRLKRSAGFEVVHAAQKEFPRAVEFVETYDGLSVGDATIAASMDRTGLEYLYSFDDDFDPLDHVIRLSGAEDPFGG